MHAKQWAPFLVQGLGIQVPYLCLAFFNAKLSSCSAFWKPHKLAEHDHSPVNSHDCNASSHLSLGKVPITQFGWPTRHSRTENDKHTILWENEKCGNTCWSRFYFLPNVHTNVCRWARKNWGWGKYKHLNWRIDSLYMSMCQLPYIHLGGTCFGMLFFTCIACPTNGIGSLHGYDSLRQQVDHICIDITTCLVFLIKIISIPSAGLISCHLLVMMPQTVKYCHCSPWAS